MSKELEEKYEALAAQLDDAEDVLNAVYLILNSIALGASEQSDIGQAYDGRMCIRRYMKRWENS